MQPGTLYIGEENGRCTGHAKTRMDTAASFEHQRERAAVDGFDTIDDDVRLIHAIRTTRAVRGRAGRGRGRASCGSASRCGGSHGNWGGQIEAFGAALL